MSIEKAMHQLSRELWCLKREPTLTEFGRGFIAGIMRGWRELTGDWKITESEVASHWGCVEWSDKNKP